MSLKYLLLVICAVLLATQSFAVDRIIKRNTADVGRRIALVIGNGNYKAGKLKNPVNDAVGMATALAKSGFQVELHKNADQRQMEDAIRGFGKRLRAGGVGLFYFAGHGIQYRGNNYLVPVNAAIADEVELKYRAVNAEMVLGKMELAANDLNIVILDACRNNPFARSFRSAEKGLTEMNAAAGSLIAYATAPGSVAADGRGSNGIYTKNLLKYINQPGLSINQLFIKVRNGVLKDTDKKQTPWESSSLTANFYFRQSGSTKVPAAGVDIAQAEASFGLNAESELWQAAKQLGSTESFQIYLAEYPAGRYRSAARLQLAALAQVPSRCRFTVATKPVDARVRIFNIASRYAAGMELEPGRYQLEVSAAGYGTITRWINLPAATEHVVEISLESSDIWVESSTGMEFVYVKGGCYQMGDTFGDGSDNEKPVHEVCVAGFYMGSYEVSQGEYQQIVGSNPSSFQNGDNYPVEQVSWDDAQSFIAKLNSRSGKTFRLPTEAEWEYAARERGKQVRFGTGKDTIGPDEANFVGSAELKKSYSRAGVYRQQTTAVGSFAANALGLYDMAGNVWEWCSDWYDGDYYSSSSRDNPQGPTTGSNRVIRGGGWSSYPRYVRAAYRSRYRPGDRGDYLGFRLVLSEGSR